MRGRYTLENIFAEQKQIGGCMWGKSEYVNKAIAFNNLCEISSKQGNKI